jgi:uncharacterized protein (DUF1800 family)
MADSSQITHLLRRTEYVARPARVAALSAGTLAAAVDNILNVEAVGTVALPAYLNNPVGDGQGYEQWTFAVKWWLDRMINSPKPLQEKMTFFWHGHFTSAWDKVNEGFVMCRQNKLYRDNALGNFRNLAQAMAVEPAMLMYLDNDDNESGSPNQNFARELMELFLLGVGNYTEQDVIAAAQAWTGYGINPDTYAYEFHNDLHDYGNKTFFGTTKDWAGPQIIDEILLNNSAKRTIAARFVTKKLWEYFAYQNPEAAVLDALAPGFGADWNIKSLLRAMFLRPEFYSAAAINGMVRNPVEWAVAAMFHTGIGSQAANPQWYLEGMGQEPFNPPNVSGWRPNGYWINTSSFGRRAEFARSLTWPLREAGVHDDLYTMPPAQVIDTLAVEYGVAPLSAATRAALAGYLAVETNQWWKATNMITMTMLTPEMHAV